MRKILFFLLFYIGALTITWAAPSSKNVETKNFPVTYEQLRPRLLLVAKADIIQVEQHPEYLFPSEDSPSNLYLANSAQVGTKKQKLYRVVDIKSFTAYTSLTDPHADSPEVYSISLEELNDKLEPTGTVIELGTKNTKTRNVIEFDQIPDSLSLHETLTTQRAQVGDHIINAFPTQFDNNIPISSYSEFEIIDIGKTRVPFTLTYEYKLTLKKLDDDSNNTFEIKALGYLPLKNWALIVAKKNIRAIKLWGVEINY